MNKKSNSIFVFCVMLFILVLSLLLFSLLVVIFVPVNILFYIMAILSPIALLFFTVIAISFKIGSKVDRENESKMPLIFQVPKNHQWVLRASIGSSSGNPLSDPPEKEKWYFAWSEGWAVWCPIITVDEGVVSMQPKQRNLSAVKVNSSDGQDMIVDGQMTTKIINAIRFVINMPGETIKEKEESRIEIEDDLVHTAFNKVCVKYDSVELQSLTEFERNSEGKIDTFNPKQINGVDLKINLGKEVSSMLQSKELAQFHELYGIEVLQLGTQKIYSPAEVSRALGRKRAATIEREGTRDEALAMKETIKETGANATIVALGHLLADAFRVKINK